MRFLPHACCLIGVVAAVFGYWGINSRAGRRIFDEMAGMIPLAVGILGLGFLAIGIVWLVVRARSS